MSAAFNSTTTLAEICIHGPCEDGWTKLLAHLGKTKADDEPLALLTILDSNGLDYALWCLRVKSLDRLSRHFRAWCVEQVLPHFLAERPDDGRVAAQIAMLRNDDATDEERAAARVAARTAASDAARNAVWTAAWAAASDAAWAAASDAAWDAARDAARAAAWTAARDVVAEWTEWTARATEAATEAASDAQEVQLRKMIMEAAQ